MIRALGLAALAGAVAGAVALVAPVDRSLVLDVYLLVVGAVFRAAAIRIVAAGGRAARTSAFERALVRHERRPARPAELVRLEDQVALATVDAGDLHFRLRPLLADVAAHRLATRHGVDVERAPDRARALLGDEAWDVVRPDVSPPSDRLGPGIPTARLEHVVDMLERL